MSEQLPKKNTGPGGEVEIALNEDSALALLSVPNVQAETCERIAKSGDLLKSRKVKVALVCHPRTPRHVSVPVARQLYTFDLMKVALSPTVISDIKVAVDDILISRLKVLSLGERVTLARRATGRVASALLLDGDDSEGRLTTAGFDRIPGDAKSGSETQAQMRPHAITSKSNRVMQAALENPRLTEALVIKSILSAQASAILIDAVSRHSKWSKRRDVRAALLRTEYLSLARALDYSRDFQTPALIELLASSRLPDPVKEQLVKQSKESNRVEKA